MLRMDVANLQPLPADPEKRAAVARVVDWTTRYKLTRIWGAPADREGLEAALAEAHALGHAPTIAQVEHVAGTDVALIRAGVHCDPMSACRQHRAGRFHDARIASVT